MYTLVKPCSKGFGFFGSWKNSLDNLLPKVGISPVPAIKFVLRVVEGLDSVFAQLTIILSNSGKDGLVTNGKSRFWIVSQDGERVVWVWDPGDSRVVFTGLHSTQEFSSSMSDPGE